MVVVEESLPTVIWWSPSGICWAQYGCNHATEDTWPAYTMGMIQFSILSSLTGEAERTYRTYRSTFRDVFGLDQVMSRIY